MAQQFPTLLVFAVSMPFVYASHAEEADAPVTRDGYNSNLLGNAIVFQINAERQSAHLAPLESDVRGTEAAALQSAFMAETRTVSHTNSRDKALSTLEKRLDRAAVSWTYAEENVAQVLPISATEQSAHGGREITLHIDPATARPASYTETGAKVVRYWMNSEGHRKNILSSRANRIGVSCSEGENVMEVPLLYCVAVFLVKEH